jgi:hypothetical protein
MQWIQQGCCALLHIQREVWRDCVPPNIISPSPYKERGIKGERLLKRKEMRYQFLTTPIPSCYLTLNIPPCPPSVRGIRREVANLHSQQR